MSTSQSQMKIDDSGLRGLKEEWERRQRAAGITELPSDLAESIVESRRRTWQTRGVEISDAVTRYIPFTSANPILNFTFLFPENWQTQIFEDDAHAEVFILGPRNAARTFNLALSAHTYPTRAAGGKYETLEQITHTFLGTHRRLAQFKERALVHGFLGSLPAVEIAIGYALTLLPRQPNAKEIPIVEHRIILERQSRFYELVYAVAEADYATYLPAFRYFATTFKFQTTDEVAIGYALIDPAPARQAIPEPAHALAEKSEEYETKK
ncbi:MAG: hypothetical protein AB1817_03705 [Chloroflexota bacterium]